MGGAQQLAINISVQLVEVGEEVSLLTQ